MKKSLLFLCILFIFISFSLSAELAYDGLWFLGFNLNREVFQGDRGFILRQAINQSINREYINKYLMQAPILPNGYIPEGMAGYNPSANYFEFNPSKARLLLSNHPKYQEITLKLLHTDGVKTDKVAIKIKQDLEEVGIKVVLETVNYAEGVLFEEKLQAGDYDLFLMGYKTQHQETKELFNELFTRVGMASFFRVNDPELEKMIISLTPSANLESYQSIQDKIWEKQVLLP
ncbi:MAG: hypothetical protein KKA19_06890, partial [Candidatus Margulisbacteria bacterium]|nr:hypothetical protein [Candidatus Margulisiibacteriota bacterium]